MINEYKKQYDTLEDLGYEVEMISQFENYNNDSYICDIISEISDNYVNIYNHQLWELAPLISDYIEDSINEFGTPSEMDLVEIFQIGQYYYNERVFYENLEDIIFNLALQYLEHELGLYCPSDKKVLLNNIDDLISELETELLNVESGCTLDDIEEIVRSIISNTLEYFELNEEVINNEY